MGNSAGLCAANGQAHTCIHTDKGICELGTGTGWEETRKMQIKWNRMKTMKMIMTELLVHIVIPESTRIIIKIIMTMTMMMMIIIMTDEDDTD